MRAADEKLIINELGPYAERFPGADDLMSPSKDAEANLLEGGCFTH